ncbi:hypothetical protein BX666DRAFT_2075704, partial [Dichotomocladium elegans]
MADLICLQHPASTVQSQAYESVPTLHSAATQQQQQQPQSTASLLAQNHSTGGNYRRLSGPARESPTATPSLHVRIVPNIENPSRALIFDVFDRELTAGSVIKLGRFADQPAGCVDYMSFKSKVVSRSHCEIWVHSDGKLYIRDTCSSSGTFLNHVRLSQAGQESPASEITAGDIVQLGVDYQGGEEEIYRSVKMKFELDAIRRPRPLSFHMSQLNNLKTLSRSNSVEDMPEVDECCICLYALAPFQALFVAPCSHSFHFMCIQSLLKSYPGFQCPICRTYSNLLASVAMEPEEIMAKYGLR